MIVNREGRWAEGGNQLKLYSSTPSDNVELTGRIITVYHPTNGSDDYTVESDENWQPTPLTLPTLNMTCCRLM